ncbi:MAG: superoxide dismutase [Chitinophagaceae bacterium]|nr:superoxide dismutase [Chitinophagaceae bacterium]MCW5904302.1 superoxide dismutase [Chitinophagaceae bacterium]
MKNNKIKRRKFITDTTKAGIALAFVPSFLKAQQANTLIKEIDFTQQPLAYGYKDLEPYIDAATMEIHYTKHAAGYAKNLNDAVKEEYRNANAPFIESILNEISRYSAKMRNNAGGHYNHELFWQLLTPTSTGKPTGKLAEAINSTFGSVENCKKLFSDAALKRFGSGWAWLINTKDGLKITSTPNQDNPLMDIAETKGYPILGLDVWEHAYYLKYQNKRGEYINNWWNIVNWNVVEKRFDMGLK